MGCLEKTRLELLRSTFRELSGRLRPCSSLLALASGRRPRYPARPEAKGGMKPKAAQLSESLS